MNQKALEALRAFVECGSVAAAAERMLRTAPQVSRLLAQLEQEAGFAILARRGRSLSLTAEGRRFYAEVEQHLIQRDELIRSADQIRRGRRDHVRVLSSPFISHALVNRALARTLAANPGATAQVDSRVRLDIDAWVGSETFDLAVVVLPIASGAFEVEPLMAVNAVATMRPDHPLAALKVVTYEEFVRHDIIITHSRSLLGRHLETLGRTTGLRANVRAEARNGVVAAQLAAEGIGCCISDPFVARSSGVSGLELRPFRPALRLHYGLLRPSWLPRSEVVEELAAEIRAQAAAALASDDYAAARSDGCMPGAPSGA